MARIRVDAFDRDWRRALACALVLLGLAWVSFLWSRTPPAAAADADPETFSATRAAGWLQEIAAAPRPVGSAEHARVRDLLVRELEELGLDPQVQRELVATQRRGGISGAWVANIAVRIPGEDSTGAVALVSHYDSVTSSPGAGDAGSGVVTLLETVRALLEGPALLNDVVVLITDAEELGLLGARAFVESHPWAENVRLVLNFEARGNRGRVWMFETGERNGRIVRAFGREAPHPTASSLTYEVYRRMPNDTDFSVFRRAGKTGLNFAFIGRHAAYHSALDSTDRLDLGSVQQEGGNALAMARHFGMTDLRALRDEDAVYFNPLPNALAVYGPGTARLLAFASAALLVALIAWGVRLRVFDGGGVLYGLAVAVGSLLLGPLGAAGVWRVFRNWTPHLQDAPHGLPHSLGWIFVALALMALTVMIVLVSGAARRVGAIGLLAGGLVMWALLALATAQFLTGASYLFQWPLIAGLVGLAIAIGAGAERRTAATLIWVAVALAPWTAFTLFLSTAWFFYIALTLHGAGLAMAPVCLLMTLALPIVAAINARFSSMILACLVGGAVVLAAVGLLSKPGAETPATSSLLYAVDADSAQAWWVSFDDSPDPWVTAVLGDEAEKGSLEDWLPVSGRTPAARAATEPAPLSPPTAAVELDDWAGAKRRLRLRLRSGREAPVLRARLTSLSPIDGVSLAGMQFTDTEQSPLADPLTIVLYGVDREGVAVTLLMSDRQPVKIELTDQSWGLPEIETGVPGPRPDEAIRSLSWFSDATFVTSTIWF